MLPSYKKGAVKCKLELKPTLRLLLLRFGGTEVVTVGPTVLFEKTGIKLLAEFPT
jgi:hypothetical protein